MPPRLNWLFEPTALTMDGFNAYPDAVEYNLASRVDFAHSVKEFGGKGGGEARRYAPPRLIGADKMRATLVLYCASYNSCKSHKSIRMTPAMAAAVTRKPWTLADLLKRRRRRRRKGRPGLPLPFVTFRGERE